MPFKLIFKKNRTRIIRCTELVEMRLWIYQMKNNYIHSLIKKTKFMENVITLSATGITLAVLAHFIFGFIWYTPLFGKAWAKEMGISFDEARVIKEIIDLQKEGKDTGKLLQLGVTKSNIPTTKDKRRQLLTKLMLESLS